MTNGEVSEPSCDKRIEVYKVFFELWLKTREERHDYNKYFLTLLFVDTLIGVVTRLLSATTNFLYPDLVRILLLVILATAFAVSLVWASKLYALNIVEGSQQDVLKQMEAKLGFQTATITFNSERIPFLPTIAASTESGVIGVDLFGKRQAKEEGLHWWRHFLWWASYWALPLIFIVVFGALFLWILLEPSALLLQNATMNATHKASNIILIVK